MFCKSALRSQVQTILNCHVLRGTLTEVDYILQKCAEIPGTNGTCHVFRGTLTEVDDVLQDSAEIPGANHAVHELHAEEGFGFGEVTCLDAQLHTTRANAS